MTAQAVLRGSLATAVLAVAMQSLPVSAQSAASPAPGDGHIGPTPTAPTSTSASQSQAPLAGPSTGPQVPGATPANVDDIIVTAQKRNESLQNVPIVVTTVNRQLLQDTGVKDIKDLALLAPGLLVTSTSSEGSTTARIRGIGTVGDNPGLESSVGIVIDGVYRSRNGVGFGDIGDIDRIEVLKGPRARYSANRRRPASSTS